METPLVRCSACEREWHSATLAEGLRDVGACPRCSGTLVWAEAPAAVTPAAPESSDVAPHLVLGVPRR